MDSKFMLNDIVSLVIILTILLVLLIIQHYIFQKVLFNKQLKYWHFFLLKALNRPFKILIIIIASVFIIEFFYKSQNSLITSEMFYTIKIIALISAFTWWILGFIKRLEKHFLRYNEITINRNKFKDKSRPTIILLMKLCFVTVFVLGILMLLHTMGVRMQAIIAFLSLSGVAIGISSRDLIASLFGALMIYTNRPFSIGDRIRIQNSEGIVENITWVTTSIRVDSKKIVFVPNIQFLTFAVENISYSLERRMLLLITVFSSDFKSINESIEKCIMKMRYFKVEYEDSYFDPNIHLEVVEIDEIKTILKLKVFLYKYISQSDFILTKMKAAEIVHNEFQKSHMRFNVKFED